MKQYIIPANSKKSQLIFGLFRWIDLGILGFGILLSFAFLLAIDGDGLTAMFIKFLPLLLSVFLVFPVPYYHNVMEFIKDVYSYYKKPKKYLWRGWCASYVGRDEEKK